MHDFYYTLLPSIFFFTSLTILYLKLKICIDFPSVNYFREYFKSLNILIGEIQMLISLQYHCALDYYSFLLIHEPLLNKDTFQSSEGRVRSCSLFSLNMEPGKDGRCSLGRTQAGSVIVIKHQPEPLGSAVGFPALEIPPFILFSHPSIPESCHASVDLLMVLNKVEKQIV